jgi:hypothetical protein
VDLIDEVRIALRDLIADGRVVRIRMRPTLVGRAPEFEIYANPPDLENVRRLVPRLVLVAGLKDRIAFRVRPAD